jgi:hypothetical protein
MTESEGGSRKRKRRRLSAVSGTAVGLEFLSVTVHQRRPSLLIRSASTLRRDTKCQRAIIKSSGRQISIKQNSGLER